MAPSSSVAIRSAAEKKRREKKARRARTIKVIVPLLCTIVAFTALVGLDIKHPIPLHTSILSGEKWLQELLHGHPARMHDQLGLSARVFSQLLLELQVNCGLTHAKSVTAGEQLAIFLYWVCHGASSCLMQERFQCSAWVITKYVVLF